MTNALRRLRPRLEGRPAARAALCDRCGAPVLWAVTTSGRPVALDVDPADDGDVFLVGTRPTAQVLGPGDVLVDRTTLLYLRHPPRCRRGD